MSRPVSALASSSVMLPLGVCDKANKETFLSIVDEGGIVVIGQIETAASHSKRGQKQLPLAEKRQQT
jgi:hypothetical protein